MQIPWHFIGVTDVTKKEIFCGIAHFYFGSFSVIMAAKLGESNAVEVSEQEYFI